MRVTQVCLAVLYLILVVIVGLSVISCSYFGPREWAEDVLVSLVYLFLCSLANDLRNGLMVPVHILTKAWTLTRRTETGMMFGLQ